MINSVKVINHLDDELIIELRSPEKSGFLISDISGLGPEKAEIRMTDIVTNDGAFYNSSRLPPRNIIFVIRFMGKPTVEEVRQESYRYFPIKKPITLIFETNNRICEINGYVESNEPVIFANETQTQISIVCPYPYFYAGGLDGNNVTIFFGVEPLFEFPFSNEDLVEPLLIFGEIKNNTEELIRYSGDSEVGVTIFIDAIGEVHNLVIHNVGTRESMFINTDRLKTMTGSGIIAGDRIIISTVRGDKSITLLRGGIYTNILNVLDRGSDWFQLTKGDNIFAFEAESGTTNLMFRIENRKLYDGV